MLTCTSPGAAALTLAELKAHMRVENSDENDDIEAFGLTAQRWVESAVRQTVNASSWQVETRNFIIPLEMSAVTTVDAVVTVADDGTETALTDYRTDRTQGITHVIIGENVTASVFRVRWTAQAESVYTDELKIMIKLLASTWYAHRESVSTENVKEVPHALEMMARSITLARL